MTRTQLIGTKVQTEAQRLIYHSKSFMQRSLVTSSMKVYDGQLRAEAIAEMPALL